MGESEQLQTVLDKFTEVATAITHEDIRARLQGCLKEEYENSDGYGPYCYVMAVLGDDLSGEVVYYAGGDVQRAPYTMTTSDTKATCSIAFDRAIDVVPMTKYLATEAAATEKAFKPVDLTGDVIPLREGAVGQDGTAHLKLIAPGWGSSGFYSAAVLERDGPAIFKAGTKNFWNHQTDAEEAARPEGDLRDLASVLTEDARYDVNGAAGPGLYAKAKVFEEFRQPVDDLAKHIGMSIRATGTAKEGTAEGRKGPIIEKLTSGISVDYVTTPGAGGKILQLFEAVRAKRLKESANPQQEAPMTDAEKQEFQRLQEAATKATEALTVSATATRKTQQKLARLESREIVKEKLSAISLPEKMKSRMLERICAVAPITTEGDLDTAALNMLVEAKIKEAGEDLADLTGDKLVAGMGAADEPKLTEAERAQADKDREKDLATTAGRYGFGGKKVGARIFNEGRDAFDLTYNARDKEVA